MIAQNQIQTLSIILSATEWNEQLKTLVYSSKNRQRFSTRFDDLLSFKMQKKYGINCWFRSK